LGRGKARSSVQLLEPKRWLASRATIPHVRSKFHFIVLYVCLVIALVVSSTGRPGNAD
jgi:hypothetical protein